MSNVHVVGRDGRPFVCRQLPGALSVEAIVKKRGVSIAAFATETCAGKRHPDAARHGGRARRDCRVGGVTGQNGKSEGDSRREGPAVSRAARA